jgi:TolB protein
MREQVRQQVKQEADEAEESLSDDELERRVEERLQEKVASYVRASLLGILSPDGKKLLFLRYEVREKILYSLYLIDLETGEEPLVLSAETDWIPVATFSPDGRQILFESNRDGGRSLYLANADGTSILRVVKEGALNPCWH